MDTSSDKPGLGTRMVVVYMFWLITTPQEHPRIGPFLASLQFEKIIAAATLLGILLQGSLPRVNRKLVGLMVGLYLIMLASFLTSPYADDPLSQHWAEDYWKKIIFFLFIVFGVRNLGELAFLIRWTVYIVLFYQIISWRDFLSGGSYVFQQGIVRMCGAWAARGIGAANAWASMNAVALPLAVGLLRSARTPRSRAIAGLAVLFSVLSILYSGTRGGVLVGLIYATVVFRRQLFRPLIIILLGTVVGLAVAFAPQSLWERYTGALNFLSESNGNQAKTENIAQESAHGRIEGLIDGIELGFRRPILGYGPGASFAARKEIRVQEVELQLHNLYGQVVAELGFIGLAVWAWLIVASMREGRVPEPAVEVPPSDPTRLAAAVGRPLLHSMMVLFMYGMFTHNLYDFRWLFLLGCLAVLSVSKLPASLPAEQGGWADGAGPE